MSHLLCGFAQTVITPKLDGPFSQGHYLDGFGARQSPVEGVLDDLYAKAGVFGTENGERFAVVSLDLVGLPQPLYEMFADYIEGMTGIDRAHTAICCTHTHSGPVSGSLNGMPVSLDLWCHAAELTAKTVLEAASDMCECTYYSAVADTGLESSWNRRGRSIIDRRIKAAVFTDAEGKIKGVIANASCHPVVGGSIRMKYSADYPRVLTRESIAQYGVPFLFLQGRSGDINPTRFDQKDSEEMTELLGSELYRGVVNVVEKASKAAPTENKSSKTLLSDYQIFDVPLNSILPLKELEAKFVKHLKLYSEMPWNMEKHAQRNHVEWYRKMMAISRRGEIPKLDIPLQVFVLDETLAFLFLPFELLTSTGNKLEKMLRGLGYEEGNIYIVGHSNMQLSYLPPEEEFGDAPPLEYEGKDSKGGKWDISYEVTGAARWGGFPEFGEKSEPATLKKIEQMISSL